MKTPELKNCPVCKEPVRRVYGGFYMPNHLQKVNVRAAKEAGFTVLKNPAKASMRCTSRIEESDARPLARILLRPRAGVGFRYSVKQLSLEFDVTGWVKNLPDGRVELVAEGDETN